MKKGRLFVVIVAAIVVLAATVLITGYLYSEKYTFANVVFNNADGTVTTERILKGSDVSFPESAEFDGYTFLGWVDESEEIHYGTGMTVWKDQSFTTLYTVALGTEEHNAFIFPDEDGLFFVNVPFTKAEAAKMICSLLSAPVEVTGNFIDVDKKADYAQAASALYTLEIIDDNRLHPEEYVTRGELISMLAAFYPQTDEKYDFKDVRDGDYGYQAYCTAASLGWIASGKDVELDPDDDATKLDAAIIINNLLGRHLSSKVNLKLYDGIITDLSYDEDGFADAIEACIGHTYKEAEDGEIWIKHDEYVPLKTGFILKGTKLRYIDDEGRLVRNDTVDGFQFDEDGYYTSGSPELDELVQDILKIYISDEMSQEEMLKSLYGFMTHNFVYKKQTLFKAEDSTWYNDASYEMLTEKAGNCYYFTATYYTLVRAIGVKAVIHTGRVGSNSAVHCWPTVFVDGVEYLCDPELEYATLYRNGRQIDMFMQDLSMLQKWNYVEYQVRKAK